MEFSKKHLLKVIKESSEEVDEMGYPRKTPYPWEKDYPTTKVKRIKDPVPDWDSMERERGNAEDQMKTSTGMWIDREKAMKNKIEKKKK